MAAKHGRERAARHGRPPFGHVSPARALRVLCIMLLSSVAGCLPRSPSPTTTAGGTEISFTMAIDYTASNGNPADPRSLHYVDPTGVELNDYAKAMSGIGRVLEFYGERKAMGGGGGVHSLAAGAG